MTGTALVTQFQLTAAGWVDDQLPLTYAWTAISGALELPVRGPTGLIMTQASTTDV
jgi:hypothetical protein